MLLLSPPSANPNNPRLLCLLANGVLGCTLRFRPREFPRYCLFIVSNIIRVFFVPPVPFRSFRSIRSFRLSSAFGLVLGVNSPRYFPATPVLLSRFRLREFHRYVFVYCLEYTFESSSFSPPFPSGHSATSGASAYLPLLVLCSALIRRDIFPPHRSCSRGSAREKSPPIFVHYPE